MDQLDILPYYGLGNECIWSCMIYKACSLRYLEHFIVGQNLKGAKAMLV